MARSREPHPCQMNQYQKPLTKTKNMINRGKSKTMNEVKPVENIRKNLQSFLEISPVQKEVLPSHKLQNYAHEYQNPFGLKEDNQSSSGFVSRARMSGEFDSRKNSQSTKLK